MAIVHISRGGSMTRDTYQQIAAKMGTEQDPPAGLIVHTAGEVDGAWQVIDIWETHEARERFEQDRLMPAIESLFGAESMAEGRPEQTEYEAAHVITPSSRTAHV
jgi:hypothetical protein